MSATLPQALEEDFHSGRRSDRLRFCMNDAVRVKAGPYASRVGVVVALDRTRQEASYLVDFADGTDELVLQSQLEAVSNAV
jgi:transcription antitermination factor NusG